MGSYQYFIIRHKRSFDNIKFFIPTVLFFFFLDSNETRVAVVSNAHARIIFIIKSTRFFKK